MIFYFYLSKKIRLDASSESPAKKNIRLDFSCESSARQRIHLKHQVLFSLKNNEKYLRMSSAAVVIGALRVNYVN